MIALDAASGAILAVGQCHFSVVEFEQRFLNQILNLFDMNEKRAFTPHPKFDFSLHLPSDTFVLTLGHTGCGNGVGDFVTKPRNHAWLAGSVARHVSADHPWEFNGLTVMQIIAEDELRTRSVHEFWDLCV